MATGEGSRRPGLVSDDLNTQLQPQANSFVCIYFSLLNKSVNKYGFGWLLLKLCICAPRRLPLPSPSPSVHHAMKHYSPEFYLDIVLRRCVGLWRTGVYVVQTCTGIPAHMTLCRRCERSHRHR